MKTFFLLLFIFIILIVLSGCNVTLRRDKTTDIIEDVRTTSYTHNEPDHYQFGKLTCLGTTSKTRRKGKCSQRLVLLASRNRV